MALRAAATVGRPAEPEWLGRARGRDCARVRSGGGRCGHRRRVRRKWSGGDAAPEGAARRNRGRPRPSADRPSRSGSVASAVTTALVRGPEWWRPSQRSVVARRRSQAAALGGRPPEPSWLGRVRERGRLTGPEEQYSGPVENQGKPKNIKIDHKNRRNAHQFQKNPKKLQ